MAARDALAHSEPILTQILTSVLSHSPNLGFPLLTECGRTFHNATANVLFRTFLLPDDDEASNPVVRNPARYASRIKTLVVVDPPHHHQESTLFELEEAEEEEPGITPLSGEKVKAIVEKCENVEELIWASSVPPPNGICEARRARTFTHTPHLKRFSFAPTSVPPDHIPPLKWDAPSLSVLPPLAHLHLTRLSQAGASALASHPPDVQHLELDFVWLDDWVCERLARIPRVRRITLGTGGTKLTDRGVGALVEGCEALEVLELVEVQGRLSKSLWSNVELCPTLHTLKIALSEGGPHHSWTADHLLSLPLLAGLDQLTRISITRTYNGHGGQIDDVAAAKPVPKDIVDAFQACNNLKHLECDWWAWGIDDLKELVEGCVNLQTLRITLDAPFTRLLSLTSSFAHLAHLTHLYVSVPTTHAPSAPPSPLIQTPGVSPLGLVNGYGIGVGVGGIMIGSPTSSPLSLTRSLKSPAKIIVPVPLPESESPAASPVVGAGNTNEVLDHATLDALVPPLREVRKFMRRCPKLVLLEWFGRTGRGAWVAHREDAKSVAGIKVEYQPPCADESTWPSSFLGAPRKDAEWAGAEADAAAEAVREYEAERDGEIEREKEARRKSSAAGRKRGATVSSGVVPDACGVVGNGKPRRRQSSASEGLGKPKLSSTRHPLIMSNTLYSSPGYGQSSVPIPTTRPPPNRAPARTGPTLRRGKTLTRPERGVAPVPLINPPAPLLPAPGAQKVVVSDDGFDVWVTFSRVVTFWAPSFLLSSLGGMKDPAIQQAWREKVALCIIAAVMGGVVGFATIGLERVLCPESAVIKPGELARIGTQPGTLGLSGQLVNISSAVTPAGVDFFKLASDLPGQDITALFTRTANDYANCRGANYAAATDNPCPTAASCPLGAPNQQTLQSLKITNTSLQVGYDWDQVTDMTNLLVIDGAVLNFTPYMTQHPNAVQNDAIDTAIRTVLRVRPGNSGKDATRLFSNRAELLAAMPCLTERYYAGRIDKLTPGCFVSSLFLYISLIVILSIVLVRFAMACVFNWFLSARMAATPKNLGRTVVSPAVMPEGANLAVDSKNGTAPWSDKSRNKLNKKNPNSRSASPAPGAAPLIAAAQIGAELYSVCLVTCYSEGEGSLRTTLDSISATNYSDDRKLLFVIADGMVTGAGEKMSTPDTCVSLLEADPRFGNPVPMAYGAIGSGAKKANRAMVYAGHYTKAGRRTPTVIVVKCGTEAEAATDKKPGNRGKRDSQLILMNFFSCVTYNDRMTPLDFDLFRKIHVLMGVTPDFFEVCLMVDADTKVFPESLKQLVNCMHHDNYIMGVCGETRIANKRESWVTAIQVYEYFISHHLAKAFESVFGGVTCLPGCFSLYRLKARKADDDDWVPLLVKPEIVREYSQSEVHTLHQKNLLLLGEDRFLTTILIRTFPNRKMMFCPQARCRTIVPDTFKMLLSQRRRWINSTMHNLMELVRVRNLCGTFCFSMQFVVFMDLIGTTVLPIAIILTYVLIVTLALDPPNTFEKAIPLILLCTVIGLPAFLILITTRKVVYVFWMGIYLLALPIWNLVLPVYAYWHFDDFSWGETRKVEGEGKDTGHGDSGGVAAQVPLRRWEDWERSRLRKLKREEKRRREMERTYANYPGNTLRADSNTDYYDGGSDTVSVVSSEDDQWGHQIGGYNEASSAYPPPPNTLRRFEGSDSGLDSPSPHVSRYQLADSNGYSPVMRDGPPTPIRDGQSSAVYERGHAKRRSGNRHPDGEYGPLGPLGPPR
ncbi:unnamed protein product [Rhizoctonia solani]|uniref:chitin synthase n=1 Tax=Rhizoctonia solani TaxID=456999 RepID=A0A8H3HEQ1_9AGAM|nr:unnamed protein product [Rhizoctonia solani]